MSKVKYIRTSTVEQNNERQKVNGEKYDHLYIDKCSGSIRLKERPNGKRLLNKVKSGKIKEIHVSSIDRLGRNILDILQVLEVLNNFKVNLFVENIGMNSLIASDKPNPTFKMIVSVLGNVAEMERENMLERQKQGIAIAKAKGVYKGRVAGTKMSDEQFIEKYPKLIRELKAGESLRRAAALAGCSLGTAQKARRILKNYY